MRVDVVVLAEHAHAHDYEHVVGRSVRVLVLVLGQSVLVLVLGGSLRGRA